MRISRVVIATLASVAVVTAGCGNNSKASKAATGSRSVAVEMRDNAFSPDHLSVHAGEKVRFEFHNTGHVTHDAFLGDAAAQDNHETGMMNGGNDMGMDHGGSDAVTVEPGKTAALTHTFRVGEKLLVGCHETGHYAGGMKLIIDVV